MNIRILCLGILSFREASGYEIKKEIEEGMFSHFIDASFGSIYPALSQLNAEGLVTVRAEEQTGRPDKKVYAVTEQGREALAKGLLVIPARDKYKSEFLFEMLFKAMLPEAHVRLAIEKQLHDLKDDLLRMHECRQLGQVDQGSEFIMGYGEAVLSAGARYLEDRLAELQPKPAIAAE
ncbi:MAG: PadR family transcriptional regulator [Alphaproteobacteria bacterium]|nr:PadR family transcriptional regulator [Alphaproteobacteria bacterium]